MVASIYKSEIIKLTIESLDTLEFLGPSLGDILRVQDVILAMQVDLAQTIEALLKLKTYFADKMSSSDRESLLAAGVERPSKFYILALNQLRRRYGLADLP
jgi:hypothetical protein